MNTTKFDSLFFTASLSSNSFSSALVSSFLFPAVSNAFSPTTRTPTSVAEVSVEFSYQDKPTHRCQNNQIKIYAKKSNVSL
nr:MAG TPA: hypothetical protein [Caudoviricetes sp.]